jgi:hypothetical protein
MMQRRTVLSSLVMLGGGIVVLPAWSAGLFSSKDASLALRTALEKGAQSAVSQLGRKDGFLGNNQVRIGLPSMLEDASPLLRTLGKGAKLDELIEGMNRAAEQAVPLALPLLKSAIKSMSVTDAQQIIRGGDTAVTEFFAGKTRQPLSDKFLPIVTKVTNRLALAQQYNALAGKASGLGLLKPEQTTVQQYVTQKAMNGLFTVIGEQERLIRQDPFATGSAILKKVFGSL